MSLHRQTTSTCCVTVCLRWPARIVLLSLHKPRKLLTGTEKASFFLVPAITSTNKTMWMQTRQKSCVSLDKPLNVCNIAIIHGLLSTAEDIKNFLTYYRREFPSASVTPKLHMLEEHVVPWVKQWKMGFGPLWSAWRARSREHPCVLQLVEEDVQWHPRQSSTTQANQGRTPSPCGA